MDRDLGATGPPRPCASSGFIKANLFLRQFDGAFAATPVVYALSVPRLFDSPLPKAQLSARSASSSISLPRGCVREDRRGSTVPTRVPLRNAELRRFLSDETSYTSRAWRDIFDTADAVARFCTVPKGRSPSPRDCLPCADSLALYSFARRSTGEPFTNSRGGEFNRRANQHGATCSNAVAVTATTSTSRRLSSQNMLSPTAGVQFCTSLGSTNS
jgi:hypothetical protein